MNQLNRSVCYVCALIWGILIMGAALYVVCWCGWSGWWMLGAYVLSCQLQCEVDETNDSIDPEDPSLL